MDPTSLNTEVQDRIVQAIAVLALLWAIGLIAQSI
jgi:hypothetical protein